MRTERSTSLCAYLRFMLSRLRKFQPSILPLIVFGALWFLLIKNLSLYWAADPQYSFGWFGPLLCAYLFMTRWLSRPPTEPGSWTGAKWLFWIAALSFLPTWLVEQPNPDWRGLTWLLALEVVILNLCAVYFVGGRPWLRHFAFSLCFILTTLPWPGGLETFVIQGLMQVVAWVTVGLLNLSHIAALQHGNLIEVKSGLLGIDEACSGVRSLQASVMVSFFLGELYRAGFRRRTLFLLAGILIAFFCNVGRTFFLSWTAASQGIESVPKWHDWAGVIELGICFFALWGCVHLMCRKPLKLPAPPLTSSGQTEPQDRFRGNWQSVWLCGWPSPFSALKLGTGCTRMGNCSSGPCNCPSQNQSFASCLFPICSETNSERLPGLRMMEAVGPRCFLNGPPGRPAHAFWLGFTGRRIVSLPSGTNCKPTEALSRFELRIC